MLSSASASICVASVSLGNIYVSDCDRTHALYYRLFYGVVKGNVAKWIGSQTLLVIGTPGVLLAGVLFASTHLR